MRRRQFVTLLAGAAIYGPRAVLAQSSSKVFRLGTLTPGLPLDEKIPLGAVLLKALESTAIRSIKILLLRRAERPAR